jgi:hypothetical protein
MPAVERCWAWGPLGWWTRSDAVALWGGTHLDDWSCVPIWDKGKGEETKNRCKGKRGLQREVALHAGCHVKRKQRERGAPSKKRKCPFLLDAALPSLDSFRGFGLSLDMSPSAGLPFGIKMIFKIQVARRAHAETISLLFFSTHSPPGKSDRGLCGHRGCRLPDCRPRLFPCHCRGLK